MSFQCKRYIGRLTDGFSIFIGLALGRSSRVFTVVGEFISKTCGSDGITVDNRGTTASDHGPHATFRVEDL